MEVKSLIISQYGQSKDYSRYVPYSIKINKTLDESLDTIVLQLISIKEDKPFMPLTKAKLTLTDGYNEQIYNMAIAYDNVSEIMTSGKYIHSITLIEETKILERLLIGGKTVTNPSSRYFKNSQVITISQKVNLSDIELRYTNYPYTLGNNFYSKNFTPTNPGIFYIINPSNFTKYESSTIVPTYYYNIYFENTLIYTSSKYSYSDINIVHSFNLNQIGTYRVEYVCIRDDRFPNKIDTFEINILCVNNIIEYTRFNMQNSNITIPENLQSPILQGESVMLSEILDIFSTANTASFIIEDPAGNQTRTNDLSEVIVLSKLGVYSIYCSASNQDFIFRLTVMTQEQIDNYLAGQSITDVINNILMTYKTLYTGEMPEITFNSEQAEIFSKIESPQFSFTNQMSLWEVFSIIGGFIQGIPRLRDSVLYFDMLGGNQQSKLKFDNYVVNEKSYSVEQFCTEIVSTVDNLVNYSQAGSIEEPGDNYRTLRIEQGQAYLEEEELLILTSEPIEKLISIECAPLSDGTVVGDITDYAYERAEYQVLSSYTAVYPTSKCYAIYWAQGEKNIRGLTFRKPNLISQAFANYSIQNIICDATGKDWDWFKNTILGDDTLNLQNLMFRVTYIPRVKSKVSQKKTLVADVDDMTSQIAYNQNTTLVDSDQFGENMRGVVARLGNIEMVRTYIIKSLKDLPEVGDYIITNDGDEYYISNMIIEMFKDFLQVQIAFSKDFNRISEYVGIKNQLRFSEVAVEQVLERYITLEDNCVIGNNYSQKGDLIIQQDGITKIANSFKKVASNNGKITTVISGTSNNNQDYINVLLPVSSFGLGNSIVLSYSYEDNFSAGDKIYYNDEEKSIKRVQQQVQYNNYYGESKYLKVQFTSSITQLTDYDSLKQFGDNLPSIEQNIEVLSDDFTSQPLEIYKDNREILKVVYQLHFVTNKKSIIIGTALSTKNNLVVNGTPNFQLFVSPKRLNKLANYVDIAGMTEYQLDDDSITNSITNNRFNLGMFTSQVNGQAWCIVTKSPKGYNLVLGENTPIKAGQEITLPSFSFTHKI